MLGLRHRCEVSGALLALIFAQKYEVHFHWDTVSLCENNADKPKLLKEQHASIPWMVATVVELQEDMVFNQRDVSAGAQKFR